MLSPQGGGGFDSNFRVHSIHFNAYSKILVLCVCNIKHILWNIYTSMGQTDIFSRNSFSEISSDSELCLFL